jgi:hypothetical protein
LNNPQWKDGKAEKGLENFSMSLLKGFAGKILIVAESSQTSPSNSLSLLLRLTRSANHLTSRVAHFSLLISSSTKNLSAPKTKSSSIALARCIINEDKLSANDLELARTTFRHRHSKFLSSVEAIRVIYHHDW